MRCLVPSGLGPYTLLAADALVVKVREDGRVANVHVERPADSPGRSHPYVRMLTPPGPTSNPTMIRTIPHNNCRRKIAKMPETTKMTANTHKIVAMAHLTRTYE